MRRVLRHYGTWVAVGLGALNTLVLTHASLWHLGSAFVGAYMLLVPGFLLLSLFTRRSMAWPLAVAYGCALSVFSLIAAAMGVNMLLPLFGITTPLTLAPLLIAFDVVVLALLVVMIWRKKRPPVKELALGALDRAIVGGAVAMPILAVLGATSLNNGGANIFTMVALGLIGGYVPLLTIIRKRLGVSVIPIVLYCMALALLLMNSMRGWFITGHDVMREYHVFQLTFNNAKWDISAFRDPYNACLSITLLPTYLQHFLHLDPAYIYKFVTQFIGALPIVPIYYLFRRYASTAIAFLAAFTYISFPAFMIDMSMLNRQSVGFLFFSLLLYTILTNYYIVAKRRVMLLLLLGIGMVVSHYSTTYVAVSMLTIAYVLCTILRLLFGREAKKIKVNKPVRFGRVLARLFRVGRRQPWLGAIRLPALLTLPAVLVLLTAAVVWNGPVTRTSQGISSTIKGIGTSLGDLTNSQSKGDVGTSKYSVVAADKTTPHTLFEQFLAQGIQEERNKNTESNLFPLATVNQAGYREYGVDEPVVPTTRVGKTLHISLQPVYGAAKQIYAKLLQILLVLGLVALAFGYRFRRNIERTLPLEYVALGVAGLGLMVFQVLVPQSAIDYGILRLLQQNLMLLALPIVLCFVALAELILRSQLRAQLAYGAVLLAFFFVLSGFLPQMTGGGRPALALSNDGFYYDAYYTHQEELSSFDWLVGVQDKRYTLQTDRYFTALKLRAYTGLNGEGSRLLPETIKRNSFVLLGTTTMDKSQVVEYQNGDIVYYHLPINFLDDNKDLVYTTGRSAVYW